MSKKYEATTEALINRLKELKKMSENPEVPEVMKIDIPFRVQVILEELRKRMMKE